jgi:hypothetical protein
MAAAGAVADQFPTICSFAGVRDDLAAAPRASEAGDESDISVSLQARFGISRGVEVHLLFSTMKKGAGHSRASAITSVYPEMRLEEFCRSASRRRIILSSGK